MERNYDTYIMPAGSFHASNITDIAGAKMIMSIAPWIADLLKEETVFEERININWMYQMLWMTAVTALIMGIAFFKKEVYVISGTLSVIVYTILTVRILSFVPANIVSIRRKIDETKEEGLIIDDDDDELACEQTPAPVHSIEEKKGYAKIEPLVRKWVEEERYTQAELNIKDAASQMGKNSN